jgi:hypothetical protein
MEKQEKIQHILNSGLALGHIVQDILEVYGTEDNATREAARAVTEAICQHFTKLALIFRANGHEECCKALLLEATNIYGH